MTNTELLKNFIDKTGLKIDFICKALGMTYSTLRRKINNESEFTASEITSLTALLRLSDQERDQIFFASEVN